MKELQERVKAVEDLQRRIKSGTAMAIPGILEP